MRKHKRKSRIKMVLIGLVALLGLAVLAAGAFLSYRHINSTRSSNNTVFRNGGIPVQPPDGLYDGKVTGYRGSWRGKRFDAATSKGINLFGSGERYPFKTATGRGATDPIQVIKIDYNLKSNPLWLRPILDEIVETEPNHFLGKLQLRIGGLVFTFGYFELQKGQ